MDPQSVKEFLLKTIAIVAGILAAILLLEGISFAMLEVRYSDDPMERWEFRASRPLPYRNADYFSKEFLQESMQSTAGLVDQPDRRYFLLQDLSGEFLNVVNGVRRTTDQPGTYENTLYLFGGSSVFGQEVPDHHTIPSYLQRLVNSRLGGKYKVENYGVVAYIAQQQTARLLDTPLEKGDIIVYLDGVNEVAFSLDRNMPGGWMPGKQVPTEPGDVGDMIVELNAFQRLVHRAFVVFGDRSHSVTLIHKLLLATKMPGMAVARDRMQENLRLMATGYREAIVKARDYTIQHGAVFFDFLQPHLFAHDKRTPYENWVIENDINIRHASKAAYEIGYASHRVTLRDLRKSGVSAFDVSRVLQNRWRDEEIYLDFVHVNHIGNEMIASELFDRVFKTHEKTRPSGPSASEPNPDQATWRGSTEGATGPTPFVSPVRVVPGSLTQTPYSVDKALDKNIGTFWETRAPLSQSLSIRFDETPAVITGYALYIGPHGEDATARMPTLWTFNGSNDGVQWHTLHTQAWRKGLVNNQTYYVSVSNSRAFSNYRMTFEKAGSPILRIYEITLYDASGKNPVGRIDTIQ